MSDPYASLGVPVDQAPPPPNGAAAPVAAAADPPPQADPYAQVGAEPAAASTDAPVDAPSGFTDEQKHEIHQYIPKAKDAADLERFSLEVSGGHARIGNAQKVLDEFRKGTNPNDFGWAVPTAAKEPPKDDIRVNQPLTMDHIRQAVGDAIMNVVAPGLGSVVNAGAQDSGSKALVEHTANSLAMDYGPEVGGVIDTILHPGSDLTRNIAHERAIIQGDSEGHPIASMAGELVGTGVNAMLGNEAGAANLGRAARTGVTAAEGAAYGSGAAGPDHRLEGAITGAALGTATEAAAAGLAARQAAKAAARTANSDFAQAAERQGIDYMAADLPKATKSKFATALSSLTLGAIPLADQGAKNAASAGSAVERAASNIGSVTDRTGAGQAAQRGAQQFIGDTAEKLNALESNIPIAADAPATVSNTRSALREIKQAFSSNPKLAAAFQDPKISAYLDALTPQTRKEATGLLDAAGNPITRDVTDGGVLSWNDLRKFRSRVGEIIGKPGIASDGDQVAQLRRLYGSLSDDIRATAQQNGPKALNAWNRWNTYARARSDRIENVVSLILGDKSDKGPQSAFEAMQRLANDKGGDPLKLARALRSMPDEESASVRASILHDLAVSSPGTRNQATGDVFSPAQFVTNWNKISDRAKNVLFTGDHRKDINEIVNVLSGMKASSKFANTSKTGIAIAAAHTGMVSMANPMAGALDAALQFGGGKLLASPAFARKIAATPKSMAGAKAFWSRPWVQAMAVKNPAIAGEIQAFQHAFLNHANDNSAIVSSAVASPDEQNQQ